MLTRKDVEWKWDKEQQDAFAALKSSICSAPCLHLIDYSAGSGSLELHTDASNVALSGVLFQRVNGVNKPVAFYSRKLNGAEQNYSATDREMLAIVASLRHFRHYIQGLPISVHTDHAALTYFFTQPNLSSRQVRWMELLADFQPGLKIFHQPGKDNIPPDLLTRRPDQYGAAINAITTVEAPQERSQLAADQESDPLISKWRQAAQRRPGEFILRDGLLYKLVNGVELLVLPQSWVERVLHEIHDAQGHFGLAKTVE